MKTNVPAIIALLLWLLFVASNAFAMFKPPYPHKAAPPDQIIVITTAAVIPLPVQQVNQSEQSDE
jgi:hypothetical protein